MDKIKRFIDIAVPVQTCNLRCPYCYIFQEKKFLAALPYFMYDAKTIGKALSKERLGGICHFNLCGGGETLLPPEMTDIIKEMLTQGHYLAIVTNGTITKRFEEICKLPKEYLSRLLFKFSFHYTELKRLNLFDVFWNNVHNVKVAGASFSVELTPNDETIPYIDEIKAICTEKVNAFPHITVARKMDSDLSILTNLSREEYKKTWGTFKSNLFDFKMTTFNVKRKEFCYAGQWTATLNLGTGILRRCYCGGVIQNIFKNVNKPIKWEAIGSNCKEPHCHNSHVWLTLGNIPELQNIPTYSSMRNRICNDGSEWLNEKMKNFLSQKLYDNNKQFTKEEMIQQNKKMAFKSTVDFMLLSIFRFIRQHLPKKLRIGVAKKLRKK